MALTLAGGFLLLFLVSFGAQCNGGGAVPTIGVLLMAVPIFLGAVHALRVDLEAPESHTLRLDRGTLAYTFSSSSPQIAATTQIAAFVEGELVVQVVDGDNTCLLRIYTSSPAFVATRLRSALAHVREPRTYRT
jgi:hypothetical protein